MNSCFPGGGLCEVWDRVKSTMRGPHWGEHFLRVGYGVVGNHFFAAESAPLLRIKLLSVGLFKLALVSDCCFGNCQSFENLFYKIEECRIFLDYL